jgi:hypothetical protein
MFMRVILLPILAILTLVGCGAPEIPENYGVFARLTNGDLVKLDRSSDIQNTKMVFFGNSASIDMSEAIRAPRFNYILERPSVELDMDDVEGFIVFGEKKPDENVRIKYFADAKSFNGKFFDNNGKGNVDDKTFLDQGRSCAKADGMEHKKIEENMYLYTLPETESEDYKFCSLKVFKETGKGTRKSPYVAVDFYAWYYDGVYWTFNVENEDSEGKEKEQVRLQEIAERAKKAQAEAEEKLRLAKAELKSYDSLPIVKNLNDFATVNNVLALTAKNNDGEKFGLKKDTVMLGAFYFTLKKDGINAFEYEELKEEMAILAEDVKAKYSQAESHLTHVKITGLNIPIKLNTNGWFTISTEDRKAHLDPLVSLYSRKTKSVLSNLSEKAASFMKYPDEKFIFGSVLISPKGSHDGNGYIDLKLDEEKNTIRQLGKRNGGNEVIEELTLKFRYNDDEYRRVGTNSKFFISSFKLKGFDERIVNSDSKEEKYGPYKYKIISNISF